MYGNKKAPIIKRKISPIGKRTGFFDVIKMTDKTGNEVIKVVNHTDPELGIIFSKNENNEVIIDRYVETDLLLTSLATKNACS